MHALVPYPRHLVNSEGHFETHLPLYLHVQDLSLLRLAERCQDFLRERGIYSDLTANPAADREGIHLVRNPILPQQDAYQLQIETDRIYVEGQSERGVFYGLMTLRQLIRQYGANLPCLQIRDWPDFKHRGVMLDISRDKVPSLETLKMLVQRFAELKLNQLQLYTEHTFAYRHHETVWREASALSSQDILTLEKFCQEHYIELVPNQNSFGHFERWLRHPAYRHLAEMDLPPDELPADQPAPKLFSLCPLDPKSLHLLEDLYHQLLPHFSSPLFNVGCDETFDLGAGRSRESCEREGKGRVYLDFLSKIHGLVRNHGRIPMFWGDIVLNHPELIPELPRPCIALNWGYEADHPFESEGQLFAQAGIPYYVCPGTSSWNSLGGRTRNMLANLQSAAKAGLQHGALGYLITDWGDNGHWQPLVVSWPGFVYGAGVSWCLARNHDMPLAELLNQQLFQDNSAQMGSLLLRLGQVFEQAELPLKNQSVLFYLLKHPGQPPGTGKTAGLSLKQSLAMQQELDQLLQLLPHLHAKCPDGPLLEQELQLATRLMRHATRLASIRLQTGLEIAELQQEIKRSLAHDLQQLLQDYRQVWHNRNRPGGLEDSIGPLVALLEQYQPERLE